MSRRSIGWVPPAMAAAVWIGALWAYPMPRWWGPAVIIGAWRTPWRSAALCVGLMLLASSLGARTEDGLQPLERSDHRGEVTLVGDPRWFGPSLRVDVRVEGKRVEAWARGPDAVALAARLSGERVDLAGRLGPPPPHAPWLANRHVVGRLAISEVGAWRPGHPVTQAANGLRRLLSDGAESMSRANQSLYLGLLLGDQRDQDPLVADAFAGSGLTHLLAVSGANVAFVMSLLGPVLGRLPLGRRLVLTLGVLTFFALVTRFEPSVLRATTMAGLGAVAVTFGWDHESRRLLAGAVAILLLVDPLLARSLGFQLSVAASTGILLWSRALSEVLPGPRLVVEPLAVTVAAQAAVAPLLIPAFGGLPVASLPANLLAGPAAGPVVVWGLPAGIVAGLFGEPLAGLLHWPTAAMVGWIGAVAEQSARWPLGELRLVHLAVLAGAGLAAWWARDSFRWRMAALAVLAVAALHPAVALRSGGEEVLNIGEAAQLHRRNDVTILALDHGTRPEPVLEALRRAGVGRIDVVLAHHGGRDVAELVAVLRKRTPPRLVLAPDGHRVPEGWVPEPGSTIGIGNVEIVVESVAPRLVTSITR